MIDLTQVSVDVGPILTLSLTVISALLIFWVVRKLIRLANRS